MYISWVTNQVKNPDSTKQRIVEAARQMFHQSGYAETSLADIAEKAGAQGGSLYYFFKTKEKLLEAVLEDYKAIMRPVLLDPIWQDCPDPLQRVWALLGRYRELLIQTGYQFGCPIGNLALEVANYLPAARVKIHENFEAWRAAVRECLDQCGNRLPAKIDRDRLAVFILTVMEGGVMQSRTARSIEPFDTSVAVLRDYFARLEKAAGERPSSVPKGDSK